MGSAPVRTHPVLEDFRSRLPPEQRGELGMTKEDREHREGSQVVVVRMIGFALGTSLVYASGELSPPAGIPILFRFPHEPSAGSERGGGIAVTGSSRAARARRRARAQPSPW